MGKVIWAFNNFDFFTNEYYHLFMKLVKFLSFFLPEKSAFAHCDIPCGIYDTHNVLLAAHTIIRMTQLLQVIKQDDDLKADHAIARYTYVKEEHANLLEKELDTLRNDYFKKEHYEEYIKLDDLFKKVLKSLATARQNIDMSAAEETLSEVLEISEIFYKTKGVEPVRIKSVYPTQREVVLYK